MNSCWTGLEKQVGVPSFAEKFNTYRFADYMENVIDLLRRVTTVSVWDDGGG